MRWKTKRKLIRRKIEYPPLDGNHCKAACIKKNQDTLADQPLSSTCGQSQRKTLSDVYVDLCWLTGGSADLHQRGEPLRA